MRFEPGRPPSGSAAPSLSRGWVVAAVLLGRELRAAIGHRADPLLLGPAQPAPAQPRRRPPAQPRAAHHRRHRSQPRPDTRAYLARKDAEGETKKGALRCLKRHLTRRFHHLLSLPAETPHPIKTMGPPTTPTHPDRIEASSAPRPHPCPASARTPLRAEISRHRSELVDDCWCGAATLGSLLVGKFRSESWMIPAVLARWPRRRLDPCFDQPLLRRPAAPDDGVGARRGRASRARARPPVRPVRRRVGLYEGCAEFRSQW